MSFKKVFIFLGCFALALVLLVLGMGFVVSREFKVERNILIHQPLPVVFAHVRLLKNHDQWNAWAKKDPKIKKQYRGTDGEVGFVVAWEGNNEVGVAEQEIQKISPGKRIDYEIRMEKPFRSSFNTYLILERVNARDTKVQMGMRDEMPYPINAISLFIAPVREITKDLDASLSDLKLVLETAPKSPKQKTGIGK